LPRMVDGDAQQAARRALNLYEVVTQTTHRGFYNCLHTHAKSTTLKIRHMTTSWANTSKTVRPKKNERLMPPVWSIYA
jgi:hypothetical protein